MANDSTHTEWYEAKNVFTKLGLKYDSCKLSHVAVENKTADNKHYYLNMDGINELCKRYDVKNRFTKTVSSNDKQVDKLARDVEGLKVVMAQLVMQAPDEAKNSLQLKTKCGSVKNDPLQAQARLEVRKICEDYALGRAASMGITDVQSKAIFFDLAYKALYTQFKQTNKTDLKALADKQSQETGRTVTALQVAEDLGLAVELLQLAKKIYSK